MPGKFKDKAVLVIGGTGFIGRYLVDVLVNQGAKVSVLSRHGVSTTGQQYKTIKGDLTQPSSFKDACRDMDIVFHLGGYTHALDQLDGKSDKINWQVTVEGSRALLSQSINAGVRRFLFFSSVKAMGEGGDSCLDETTPCRPLTSYGKAKLAAEKLVIEANNQGLPSTVLRLPMVYGPGCKGNLPRMMQGVARGYFPPLPETGNRRSLVDVRDVVQAAMLAVINNAAVGKIYIVTDGRLYSTRQIYEWICTALDRKVPRWTIPLFLLHATGHVGDLIGRWRGSRFMLDSVSMDKLIGSACYSSKKIERELDFRATHFLQDSLIEMATLFRNNA